MARRSLADTGTSAVLAVAPKHAFTHRRLGEHGKLGNQLFQIAGTIGIASGIGADALFEAGWSYRDHYSLPDRFYAGPVTLARCENAWPLATIIDAEWRLYLQDIELWRERQDEIWRWLQPSPSTVAAAAEAFADLIAIPSKTAVHFRRGDYLDGNPIHRPCPPSFYEKAIAEVLGEDRDTQLLVFSDDIDWCRANVDLPDAIYIAGRPDWLDMALMTRCEHHICANSTFSWWGAFLSNDPSPIIPWVPDTLPDFRRLRPDGWRIVET